MIWINTSMFTGDIHIPNLNETCIQDFEIYKLISKWERECLELVLGKCLAEELLEQIELKTDPETEEQSYGFKDDAEDKWKWLVNGRTYEASDEFVTRFMNLSEFGFGCASGGCKKHHWEGFVTTTPSIVNGKAESFQESFLAYYVYFMWSFNNQSRTTGIGEQKPQAKNSEAVNDKLKRVDAWNYFVAKVKLCSRGGRTSLDGFIREHSELFEDFQESHVKLSNYWDV